MNVIMRGVFHKKIPYKFRMIIQRFARVDAIDPIDSRTIAMIAGVPNYR